MALLGFKKKLTHQNYLGTNICYIRTVQFYNSHSIKDKAGKINFNLNFKKSLAWLR